MNLDDVALFRQLPRLGGRVPWVRLGAWPTPIRYAHGAWWKCEGDSHADYGGNKVRTLEAWLGHARERGAEIVWAIGAYGSNHVVATLVHAPRAGLRVGAIVFPQPASAWALENAGAVVASGCPIVCLRSVIEVPFVGLMMARDRRASVMPPGGATTVGTFGAMSAAFELAEQIAHHDMPPPARIVLAVGSTCTTAGLLAGLVLAKALGVWRWALPIVHGVRVTPWPVTSRLRIANLARATLARVDRLVGLPARISFRELLDHLVIDGHELGSGYGEPTPRSRHAVRVLADAPRLDGVYSAKAAAALLRLRRLGSEPLLFWASKSTAVMAPPTASRLAAAPPALARWLAAR